MDLLSIKMLLAGADIAESIIQFKSTSTVRNLPTTYDEKNKSSQWLVKGWLHRIDGPAVSYFYSFNNCMVFEYWLDGKHIATTFNLSTRKTAEQKFKKELIRMGYQ